MGPERIDSCYSALGREPDEIADEIIENIEAGLDSFRNVLKSLEVSV